MGNSPAQCKENCGQDSNARNLEHRLGGGGGGGGVYSFGCGATHGGLGQLCWRE